MDLIILKLGIILLGIGLALLIVLWISADIVFKEVKVRLSKKIERVIYIATLSPITIGALLVAFSLEHNM